MDRVNTIPAPRSDTLAPVARNFLISLALCASLSVVAACGGPRDPEPPATDAASRRTLVEGAVEGFEADGVHVWRGLPFARPPVGALRWRAPRPPEPWDGVRDARRFGDSCRQFARPGGAYDGAGAGEPSGSEDCLYLNVYAPRFEPGDVPRGAERLPVMVWIHGGGNTIGSARDFDPTTLVATQRVVVVTTQYRLGAFGWFTHPSLREGERVDDASGNYGTLDLVRALAWVQENVEAFGGDPRRVTIFGESAGGRNVFTLLLSRRATGLFTRAIVQSGSVRTTPVAEAENLRDAPVAGDPYSSGEVLLGLLERDGTAADREAAKRHVAATTPAAIATYLRGRSSDEILASYDASGLGGMYHLPQTFRDGHVLPVRDPLEQLARGEYNRVPTILGTNRDENKLFLLFDSEHVTRAFGLLPLWLDDERRYELEAEYLSLMWKARGVDEPATAMARAQGASVYAYRFDWDDEADFLWLDLGKLLGAAHGFELPFVFGRLTLGPLTNVVFDSARHDRDLELAQAMMSYWAQHAYTGNPARGRDGTLLRWHAWSDPEPGFLVFDSSDDGGLETSRDTVTIRGLLERVAGDERLRGDAERCEIYRSFVRESRTLAPEQYAAIDGGACVPYPLGG